MLARLLIIASLLVCAAPSAAQDAAVSARITRYGRMPRTQARDLARTIHRRLQENGQRGAAVGYDPLRQVLGTALFGGPGRTRAEYDARLAQVVARLSAGLTEENLTALFAPSEGSAMRCATLFGINIAECDALAAAASQLDADLPFIGPDDGAALSAELTQAGASRDAAREIVRAIGTTMLSVPAALDSSPRGRRIALLMGECPGGLPDRETQVRAWHLGPTAEIARCLGVAIGREGRSAPATLTSALGMAEHAAVPFLRWSHGQPVREAPRPPPRPPSRDDLMAQASAHFRANRFAEAAQSYEAAASLDPAFVPAHQGLGVARMRMGNIRGAADAFRAAARLDPRSASIQVGLARALAQSGDREGAIGAYRMALSIEPGRADAQRELASLNPGPDLSSVRNEARAHFQAQRFVEAERAYRRLTQLAPNDGGAHAGLGASLFALGLAPEAAAEYRRATEIDPRNAGFFAGLGAAHERARDLSAARAAYERALALNPSQPGALAGMARINAAAQQQAQRPPPPGQPPPPQPQQPPPPQPRPNEPALPDTPTRDDIVRTLQPFVQRLAACSPTIDTTVTFRIVIGGADGMVREVETMGALAGTPDAACMETHLRGARFVRFARETFQVSYPFGLRGAQAGQAPPAEEAPPP